MNVLNFSFSFRMLKTVNKSFLLQKVTFLKLYLMPSINESVRVFNLDF